MPNATRENGTREQAATRDYDSEHPPRSALDRAQQHGFDIMQRLKYATKHHEDAIIRVAEAEERVREAYNAYREAARFLEEMQMGLTVAEQRRDAAQETLDAIRAERETGAMTHDVSQSREGSWSEGASSTVLVTSSEAERARVQGAMTEWEWDDYRRRRNYHYYTYSSSFRSGSTISSYEPAR